MNMTAIYTPEQYAQFRNLLAAFCDQVETNYKARQKNEHVKQHEFNPEILEKHGLKAVPMLPNGDVFGANFNMSGRQNGTNSTFMNSARTNISAKFADENGNPVTTGGTHVTAFVVRDYQTPINNKDLLSIPVEELGLDAKPDANVNPQFRKLFDTYMDLIKKTKEAEEQNKQGNDIMENKIKSGIEHARDSNSPENIIFHGAPGTGKTYGVLKAVAELLGENSTTNETDEDQYKEHQENGTVSEDVKLFQKLKKDDRFGFVQFHPSYDYTDFVEGLRPVPSTSTTNSPNNSEDSSAAIGTGFALKPGTFMEFCSKARKDPNQNYYFLIDEINRGDVSNIFGELFFLLDGGYRGVGVTTQYNNLHTKKFKEDYLNDAGEFDIPENVTIIGTMNDIDRSVDSFDFAMRRRFRFIEITWKDSIKSFFADDTNQYPSLDATKKLMQLINCGQIEDAKKDNGDQKKGKQKPKGGIEKILGTDYALGAAYFMNMAKASEEQFTTKKDDTWENKVEPLLHEYLRGTADEDSDFNELEVLWNKSIENPKNADSNAEAGTAAVATDTTSDSE